MKANVSNPAAIPTVAVYDPALRTAVYERTAAWWDIELSTTAEERAELKRRFAAHTGLPETLILSLVVKSTPDLYDWRKVVAITVPTRQLRVLEACGQKPNWYPGRLIWRSGEPVQVAEIDLDFLTGVGV